MRLIVDKVASEFNKIFAGTKRVGDSLRLEGKRETQLDVYNSSLLGNKTESTLNVKHSVFTENSEKIRSVNINGDPDVYIDSDGNTQPLYKTEQNLNVHNSQMLRDVAPENLEVDISRRLKVGDQADSPIIRVSSLITNAATYTVRDSGLLGGKTENTLDVRRAVDADNADLLNDTAQADLVVKEANQALFLKRSNGDLIAEKDLFVKSTEYIRQGASSYDMYEYRDYILTHPNAKNIIPDVASSSFTLTTDNGNKTWSELQSIMKDGTDSEIYKTSHIIVTSDTSSPVKTGDEFKTWIIGHADFTAKVGTLTSNIANRAVRFGSSTESYDLDGMKTLIKGTVVTTSANSNKLQNNTIDDIIGTTRSRIFTDSSNASSGLSQNEVDGFFDNTKVKTKVQGIKVDNSINSDTFATYTLTEVKNQIKNEGEVLSAKYIFADPNGGGQKSYIDITNDITQLGTDLIAGASLAYQTFEKIETIIIDNKTEGKNAIASEITNRTVADNGLSDRIDTEKARLDSIQTVTNAGDPTTFPTMVTYSDNITNALDTRVTNNENALADLGTTSNNSVQAVQNELNKTQSGAGLDTDGNYIKDTSRTYIDSAKSLAEADELLDIQLAVEANNRGTADTVLQNNIDTVQSNLTDEKSRAQSVEGDLSTLSTTVQASLVQAINEVQSELNSEIFDRGAADTNIESTITDTNNNLSNEISNRIAADDALNAGIDTLTTNLNNEISTRTTGDNTLQANIDSVSTSLSEEITDRTNADTTLQNNINSVSSDLSTETTARTNADTTLQNNINSVSSDLSTETTARTNADNTLQSNIDNTNTRVTSTQSAIGGVNETNGQVVFSGTNYLDTKTTINSAMFVLDENIKSTNHELSIIGSNLQTNIDTVTNLKVNKESQLYLDEIMVSDITAVIGTRYYVDVTTTALTLTLPTANNFDKILIHGLAGDFTINNLTIVKAAGDTIMTLDQPLIVDTNEETFTLVFVNNDWRIL